MKSDSADRETSRGTCNIHSPLVGEGEGEGEDKYKLFCCAFPAIKGGGEFQGCCMRHHFIIISDCN